MKGRRQGYRGTKECTLRNSDTKLTEKSVLRKSHAKPRKELAKEALSDDHGRQGTRSIGA